MAKIGLRYPVYKSTTDEGVIGEAIQADISITSNEAFLYADDVIAESMKAFQTGTITIGVDDLDDATYAAFLGHTVDSETSEVSSNIEDLSPYLGIGFYGVKIVDGAYKYRAIWLPKVQFAEPEDTNATKGETVTFNTPVLVGTIMPNDEGDWKMEQTFETEALAKTYLDTKAGITAG